MLLTGLASLFLLILIASPISHSLFSTNSIIYAQEEKGSSSISNESNCIEFDSERRIITIECESANLSDIHNQLGYPGVLEKKESLPSGNVWLLDAAIIIKRGAALHINSIDTSWLKIVAPDRGVANKEREDEENPVAKANGIEVFGSLKIDSVKVTSWNLSSNNYATNEGQRGFKGAEYDVQLGSPRPFISVKEQATGTTDITNSELAYLGYEDGFGKGPVVGLTYVGGSGSVIKNNTIHHLYFALYSNGARDLTIENNHFHHNRQYGIDLHTGTHNTMIRNNLVHDNGGQGIICSLDCFNITIEGNKVYRNSGSGIMFSRNMQDSIARNNTVIDETECIFVSSSHNNQIYNNTVSQCSNAGLYLKAGSTYNLLHDNIVMNSEKGILVDKKSSYNKFFKNTIMTNSPQSAIVLDDDHYGRISYIENNSNMMNNTFVNNNIVPAPEVSITYPTSDQNIFPGILTIYGTSSHGNSTSCQVSVLLNNKQPYQDAIATGPAGKSDFSKWTFTFDPLYTVIQEGSNEITARVVCHYEDGSGFSPVNYNMIIVTAARPNGK
jgi:parallel beta-helix repeat protein